jgi:hypothetical protein
LAPRLSIGRSCQCKLLLVASVSIGVRLAVNER